MTRFDVLTVGNAIVDIIARCDDQFLIDNQITKAAMNLIDAERAELLYSRMGPALEASGGSAGNTAAGVANLGGKAAYFGNVAADQLGDIFTHDIRAQGVHYQTKPKGTFPPTARSMIFVTEDGERSMNTYLGACVELGRRTSRPMSWPTPRSPISKVISGIRRAPRKRSSIAPASPMKTAGKCR